MGIKLSDYFQLRSRRVVSDILNFRRRLLSVLFGGDPGRREATELVVLPVESLML